jgi:hypothetical protein
MFFAQDIYALGAATCSSNKAASATSSGSADRMLRRRAPKSRKSGDPNSLSSRLNSEFAS